MFNLIKFIVMLLKIHSENPEKRKVQKVAKAIKEGKLIILPTDSVYTFVCNLYNHSAVKKLAQIKDKKAEEGNFSLLCSDLKEVSEYVRPISSSVFKLIKALLPGPYTFILNANNKVPKIFKTKKKTIGIRVPDNNIVNAVVKLVGNPIVCSSVHDNDKIVEYTTDPELLNERYKNLVDIIVDGGYGKNKATTIIDCTGEEPVVIREGLGIEKVPVITM